MTIPEEVDKQKLAIQEDIDELVAAARKYLKQPNNSDDNDAKLDLTLKASRLVQTVRGPHSMPWTHFENIIQIPALRTLMDAGVFHTIPTGGASMRAEEISSKTGLDKNILVRLMRAVTPLGPFREVGEEEYTHTPYSEAYLTTNISHLFPIMADYVFNPILQIGEFLRQSGWKNEMTARNNPFTLAHNCPGKTIFEYLYDNPKLLTTRSTNATAVELEKVSVDMYPWATTLGHRDTDVALTIVDVGGSHGNSLRQIEACIQGLEAQFILQDLEPVIKEHGKQLRADGLIPMAYDFLHEVQPVQGADVYYFRRIFHDWPNEPEAKQILQNTAASMHRDRSRLLIHDMIIPHVGANMTHAWCDLSVMAIGGIERTEKEFLHLLDNAGLELVKVWKSTGDKMGIVEARLK